MQFGPEITYTLIIILTIGSACVCYLIYLILRTKVTHVDQFRKNYARGLLLIIAVAIPVFAIINLLTLEPLIFNSLIAIGLLSICTSMWIVLYGLSKLKEYIKSITVSEKERNIKLIGTLVSLPVPIALFIYDWSIGHITLENIGFTLQVTAAVYTFTLFFTTIYCFFTHQLFKDFKINMIMYTGIGIAFIIIPQVLMPFNYLMDLGTYMVIFATCYNISIVFLVLGYLNFRNRMKEIQESLTTY